MFHIFSLSAFLVVSGINIILVPVYFIMNRSRSSGIFFNPNFCLIFHFQEATHKASVLLSGKIKVDNGQIYQNPVTWLKDLLGGDSYVTWNYAWSKVGLS